MKIVRVACCLFLIATGIMAIYQPALAQEETGIKETVELVPKFPKVEATFPGLTFTFEVQLKYMGPGVRPFDLLVTGPQNWTTYITSSDVGETRIRSIVLEPLKTYGQDVKVVTSPPSFSIPEPGEYKLTLQARAGDVSQSIDLTAVVVAIYRMGLSPASERYDTKAAAGKDNFFSLKLDNLGSAAVEDISFQSKKPEGWIIKFTPDKVDSLPTLDSRTVDVNIKPPARTIAGDYSITLTASGKQTQATDLNIRVTVETPTVWGWVGVGVILVVIAGLSVVFWRFGRR
ncbi:MAG: hypothetical protein HY530_07655 [Chloroflexi bacterium]|nr:hypothetical protein [Chloroflexota bacterium]